jgi:hypothetical protein
MFLQSFPETTEKEKDQKFFLFSYVVVTKELTHGNEPLLLNVYGAQESIPVNEFRQPGGSVPSPQRLFKNSSSGFFCVFSETIEREKVKRIVAAPQGLIF